MSADLPIWPTTKAVLAYTWHERALAVRYAVVPIILLIVLDGIGTACGIDINEDRIWQFVATGASLLAFAPLLVTWYLSIALGEDAARRRALFTLGPRETAVIMTNVLIALVVGLAAVLLAIPVALVAGAVAHFNELAGQITAIVVGIPAVFAWLMVFTCLSVAIAFSAAGRYIRIRDALRLTRPIAVPFTCIHIILAAIGLGIGAAATSLVGAGLEAVGLGGGEGEHAPMLDLTVSATDTIFSVIYLLLATTLFGFIYRRLGPPPEPAVSESAA